LTVLQEVTNCEHLLTGCKAFMRYATCHFLIGFFTGSKRHFIFRASLIYITHFSFLISTLFSQNILSECHRQPCQSTPSNICIRQLYNRRLLITQRAVSIVIIIFSKSCILCSHFARHTHSSVSTRFVSLRFCRRL